MIHCNVLYLTVALQVSVTVPTPDAVTVTLISAVPFLAPYTLPFASTDAILGSELSYFTVYFTPLSASITGLSVVEDL